MNFVDCNTILIGMLLYIFEGKEGILFINLIIATGIRYLFRIKQ